MKRTIEIILALMFLTSVSAFAQIEKPVVWSYLAKKISKTEAILYLKATIDDKWHIYAQNGKDGGPLKTAFTFNPSTHFKLVGKTIEPKSTVKYEPTFKMNVSYFEKIAVFAQKVKLNKGNSTIV